MRQQGVPTARGGSGLWRRGCPVVESKSGAGGHPFAPAIWPEKLLQGSAEAESGQSSPVLAAEQIFGAISSVRGTPRRDGGSLSSQYHHRYGLCLRGAGLQGPDHWGPPVSGGGSLPAL